MKQSKLDYYGLRVIAIILIIALVLGLGLFVLSLGWVTIAYWPVLGMPMLVFLAFFTGLV